MIAEAAVDDDDVEDDEAKGLAIFSSFGGSQH